MGNVRFIADLHLNHINMAHRRGFETADDMNEHIVEKWNKVVNKKDITYILGDVTMERKDGYEILDRLNGLKYVILGNHDRRQDVPALMEHVHSVSGMIDYKKYAILTHCPIHPNELDYRYYVNIHGHVHENSIKQKIWDDLEGRYEETLHPQYKNVSCEVIDYTPQLLIEICPDYRKD